MRLDPEEFGSPHEGDNMSYPFEKCSSCSHIRGAHVAGRGLCTCGCQGFSAVPVDTALVGSSLSKATPESFSADAAFKGWLTRNPASGFNTDKDFAGAAFHAGIKFAVGETVKGLEKQWRSL